MKRVKEEPVDDEYIPADNHIPPEKVVKTEEWDEPKIKVKTEECDEPKIKVKTESELIADIEDCCDLGVVTPDSVLIRLGRKYGFPHEREEVLECKRMTGQTGRSRGSEALDILVETILSQNTTDKNSHRAFLNMKGKWPTWRAVAEANPAELEAAIKVGGLSKTKAKNIQTILKSLIADGHFTPEAGSAEPSLDYMCEMGTEEIKERLISFNGVGPKTAACTVLFGFCRDNFPVDTHIFRVASRLGLVKGAAAKSRETAQVELEKIATEGTKFDLHILMIDLGKAVCHSKNPQCGECVLADICPSAKGASKKRSAKKAAVKKEESGDDDDDNDEDYASKKKGKGKRELN